MSGEGGTSIDWRLGKNTAPTVPPKIGKLEIVRFGMQSKPPQTQNEGITQVPKEQDVQLHEQALATYAKLGVRQDVEPILTRYSSVLFSTDLFKAKEGFEEIKGAEPLAICLRQDILRQTDKLILATADILEKGKATTFFYGAPRTVTSLSEVSRLFEEVKMDLDLVKEWDKSDRFVGSRKDAIELLPILGKYLFKGEYIQTEDQQKGGILILDDAKNGEKVDIYGELKTERVFGQLRNTTDAERGDRDEEDLAKSLHIKRGSREGLLEKIRLTNEFDNETNNFFRELDSLPETVILHVPSQDSFQANHYTYQELWVDWLRLPPNDRPRVLVYTPGFSTQLYQRHEYQGFMFCSSSDELRDVLVLSAKMAEEQKKGVFDIKKLTPAQKDAYDNSNLREWEGKTADTYQSLRHVLDRFNRRQILSEIAKLRYKGLGDAKLNLQELRTQLKESQNWSVYSKRYSRFKAPYSESEAISDQELLDLYKKSEGLPPWDLEVKTVLDLGTGEGRIAQMLARAGYKVMGLDVSETQLKRGRERIKEEGEGLRGERVNHDLSHEKILDIQKEGLLPRESILTDEETARNYLTVQGSFYDLHTELNAALVDWVEGKKFSDSNINSFFDISPYDEYALSDKRDMFADVGFDAVTINWHTWNEIGLENQESVLEQILNVMDRGGELMIEIPDRNFEPYVSALQKYHSEHPDEPYGTIRDPKPEGFEGIDGSMYAPRYFPSIEELILMLKSKGYEIDPKNDVETYLIEDKDHEQGERKLALKEYFVTARKASG